MKRILGLLILASFSIFAAAKTTPFINLEVQATEDEKPTHVKARVPFSLFEAMQGNLEEALTEARNQDQFRQFATAWNELKGMQNQNLLEVESPELTFTMKIVDKNVQIDFTKEGKTGLILIPIELGDLFFDETLDFNTLVQRLKNFEGTDFLTIQSEEVNVRVWVDWT